MRWFKLLSFWGTKQTNPPNGVDIRWPVFQQDALSNLDRLIDSLRDQIDDEILQEIGDRKIITPDDVSVSFQRCAARAANELGKRLVEHAKLERDLLETQSFDEMMELEYTDHVVEREE